MRAALVALAALAACSPSFAQEAAQDDWNLVQRPEQKLTMAATVFDSGVAIAARCVDDNFEVVLAGLPASDEPTRRFRVGLNDQPLHDESWTVTDDPSVSFSDFPVIFARRLRAGGTLNIVVPGQNSQPNRRYVLELPASASAVDSALTACGKPLVDTRGSPDPWVAEDGTFPGLNWIRRPTPEYPEMAASRGIGSGRVVLTCAVRDSGRVDDCVIESERPAGFGFGEASVRATERATVGSTTHPGEPQAGVGRIISFAINYRTEETIALTRTGQPARSER